MDTGPRCLGLANACLSGNNDATSEDAEQAGAQTCTPNSLDPGPAVSALVHLHKTSQHFTGHTSTSRELSKPAQDLRASQAQGQPVLVAEFGLIHLLAAKQQQRGSYGTSPTTPKALPALE